MERPLIVKKSGFTLIELLVVIAIIAILAAILFPVFASAREKARQTSCASNEKQLGLAFIQYVQDFDEEFPQGNAWGPPGSSPPWAGTGWVANIYPYVKSTAAFACPDDTNPAGFLVSYGYNEDYAYSAYTNPSWTPVISKFNTPSKTVLLFECTDTRNRSVSDFTTYNEGDDPIGNGLNGWTNVCNFQTGWLGAEGNTYTSGASIGTGDGQYFAATGRHTGGSNFLLADGHVKWLRGAKVSPGEIATNQSNPASTNGGAWSGPTAEGTQGTVYAATFSPI